MIYMQPAPPVIPAGLVLFLLIALQDFDEIIHGSQEKMTHMNLLHQDVVRRIEKYKRDTGNQPPAHMMAVYEFAHRRAIAAAEKVAELQKMYK